MLPDLSLDLPRARYSWLPRDTHSLLGLVHQLGCKIDHCSVATTIVTPFSSHSITARYPSRSLTNCPSTVFYAFSIAQRSSVSCIPCDSSQTCPTSTLLLYCKCLLDRFRSLQYFDILSCSLKQQPRNRQSCQVERQPGLEVPYKQIITPSLKVLTRMTTIPVKMAPSKEVAQWN